MESTTSEDRLTRGTVSDFIEERKYLKNVTVKTIQWYHAAFRAFEGALDSKAAVNRRIIEMRERGVAAISVNS